jgi:membrane-bound lytic murein transglycosylase D
LITAENELNINLDTIKGRLEYLNSVTPFEIEQTPILISTIVSYLKNRQKTYKNLLNKSRYYFPIFENSLQKYNVPLELKYLPIVESTLNPVAKSKVGATGLWQFMFGTAKDLGLTINSYVDNRMNIEESSDAAAKYLSQLYSKFNNWNLAIAAYNYGPRNVKRAINNSGYTNFWNLRGYLPQETANYVPSFIATLYLFEYAKDHNIFSEPTVDKLETERFEIKEMVSFSHISKILNLPIDSLLELNPSYIHQIIPSIKKHKYYVTIPISYSESFIEKEEHIYSLAKKYYESLEKPLPQLYELNSRILYRVVNGDYLGKIAKNHGVLINDLRAWNSLKNDNLKIGQKIIIYPKRFPKKL